MVLQLILPSCPPQRLQWFTLTPVNYEHVCFSNLSHHYLLSNLWIFANLTSENCIWAHLICISLNIRKSDYIFICFKVICMSLLKGVCSYPLSVPLSGCFSYWFESSLYIAISPYLWYELKIFPPPVIYILPLLVSIFDLQNFLFDAASLPLFFLMASQFCPLSQLFLEAYQDTHTHCDTKNTKNLF